MSLITLDFESFYRGKKVPKEGLKRYSLSGSTGFTYEQYIRDPEFRVHGVGIKIDRNKTVWYTRSDVPTILAKLFTPGNTHALLCHNTMFDGAILSWYYGHQAGTYWDTQGMSHALWQTESASLANLAIRCYPGGEWRKGTELESTNGIYNLTPELEQLIGNYCINDVDVTFACFEYMMKFFPRAELALLSLTLKMFIEPAFILNRPMVEEHSKELEAELVAAVANSTVTGSGKKSPEQVIASGAFFTRWLRLEHNIEVPMKPSPTLKDPQNTTWALAKDDLQFMQMREDHPELEHVWHARVTVSSNGARNRATRFLDHALVSPINPVGWLAMPLNYCAAHTLRWGGTNKVNPQNLGRGSPLRYALDAPEGCKVVVADLANIEGRMLAWFFEELWKCEAFAEGRDTYSEIASTIFGYHVDRKLKADDGSFPFKFEGFVGKVTDLGLGYQMGAPKFKDTLAKGAMGGDPVHFSMPKCKEIVYNIWRKKHVAITGGWRYLQNVIIPDMADKNLKPYQYRCLTVESERLLLPNGLYLNFPGLRPIDHPDGGYEYWNGKFWKSLYGGLLTENIIQALSRIVMGEMMIEIENLIKPLGGRVVLTVHDEIICICPDEHAEAVYDIMIQVMSVPPPWCNDGLLALAAEGGYADNYSK